MREEAPTDVLRFRELAYYDSKGANHRFYLSEIPLFRKGEPRGYVSRCNAEHVLRTLEEEHGLEEKSLDLPTPYESFRAAKLDQEFHDSIFNLAEWQNNLILNPNAKAENTDYVIMDTDGRVIGRSRNARNIIPVSIHRDGKRHVVEADVFDIPFVLRDGMFKYKDLSPETGFLTKQPGKRGEHNIRFDKSEKLYATILSYGAIDCSWRPVSSYDGIGFRACSSGNLSPELLENWLDAPTISIDALDSMRGEEPKPLFAETFIIR